MSLRHALLFSAIFASAPTASAADWGSFDASRINYSNGVFTTSPEYTDLRSKVILAGGTIAPATSQLTPAYLKTIDVFYTSFLDIPNGTLSAAEQTSLVEWVKCGGTLIVTAEYSAVPQNDSFLKPFGVTTANSGVTGIASVVQNHPVVTLVNAVQYAAEATLAPSPSSQVLMKSTSDQPFLIAIESGSDVGLGRVLALGDHTPMVNDFTLGAEQLRKNIATWGEVGACPNATASWANYGAGWPGTNGVPQMTLNHGPILGEQVTLSLENSYGLTTTALILFATKPANLQSDLGGTLLVLPKVEALITLPAVGLKVIELLPCDTTLCGVDLYMQVIEIDKGASHDLSFTRGLMMTFGS